MIDNLVILKGRLTAEPELKATPNGKSVCSFTMAVDRGFGDNKATDFINCVAWEQRAEFISKYFNKGSEIRILGEINTRKWQDKNGNNRTAFEVRVQESGFCGNKKTECVGVERPQVDPLVELETNLEGFKLSSGDDDLPF